MQLQLVRVFHFGRFCLYSSPPQRRSRVYYRTIALHYLLRFESHSGVRFCQTNL